MRLDMRCGACWSWCQTLRSTAPAKGQCSSNSLTRSCCSTHLKKQGCQNDCGRADTPKMKQSTIDSSSATLCTGLVEILRRRWGYTAFQSKYRHPRLNLGTRIASVGS